MQAELERQTWGVHAMAFSPDSKWLATANGPTFDQQGDSTVKVWDLATRKVLMTREQPKCMVRGVDFSPDGKMLAAAWGQGKGSGGVSLWDCATWKERVVQPGVEVRRRGLLPRRQDACRRHGGRHAPGSGHGRRPLADSQGRRVDHRVLA